MHNSRKHKSHPAEWGPWGDWIWHEGYQKYYRQRRNAQGEFDYDWDTRTTTATAAATTETTTQSQAETIPRDPREPRDPRDDLVAGLESLHYGSSYPEVPGNSSTHPEYALSSSASKSKSIKTSSSGKPAPKKSSSSGSKKGKEKAHSDDEQDPVPTNVPGGSAALPVQSEPAAGSRQALHDPSHVPQYPNIATSGYPVAYPTIAYGSTLPLTNVPPSQPISVPAPSHRVRFEEAPTPDDEDDLMLQEAINRSRNLPFTRRSGEPSTAPAYEQYEEEGETVISGATGGETGDTAPLDPRYRIQPSAMFQPGEVFKVLWSEPQGSKQEAPTISDKGAMQDRWGQWHYVGFRRFIVVANDEGHSTCVPILTYGRQACTKKGVKARTHGIICGTDSRPQPVKDEPKLGFAAVHMEMYPDGERLQKQSRVNYAKLITVEHNVKVLFIGRIIDEHWDYILDAVDECWGQKSRKKIEKQKQRQHHHHRK